MKPILFNTEMVSAILDGRKTVTRRSIKDKDIINGFDLEVDGKPIAYIDHATGDSYKPEEIAPYKVGDILYVRETALIQSMKMLGRKVKMLFKANSDIVEFSVSENEYYRLLKYEYPKNKWISPYWLTKETARIFLKVTDVRVERLQDITEKQAEAEGATPMTTPNILGEDRTYIQGFGELWNSTIPKNGIDKYGWNANPWVWVIEFERCEKPEEE